MNRILHHPTTDCCSNDQGQMEPAKQLQIKEQTFLGASALHMEDWIAL